MTKTDIELNVYFDGFRVGGITRSIRGGINEIAVRMARWLAELDKLEVPPDERVEWSWDFARAIVRHGGLSADLGNRAAAAALWAATGGKCERLVRKGSVGVVVEYSYSQYPTCRSHSATSNRVT